VEAHVLKEEQKVETAGFQPGDLVVIAPTHYLYE
jgi:hypothetical protein